MTRAIRKDALSYITRKAATEASLRRSVALDREIELSVELARLRERDELLLAAVAAAVLPVERREAA